MSSVDRVTPVFEVSQSVCQSLPQSDSFVFEYLCDCSKNNNCDVCAISIGKDGTANNRRISDQQKEGDVLPTIRLP